MGIKSLMYLVLDVQSTGDVEETSTVNAWVNANTQGEAMNIVSDELGLLGWAITDVIESTTTDESDYFAPCKSLDAYHEATKGLYSIRFIDS